MPGQNISFVIKIDLEAEDISLVVRLTSEKQATLQIRVRKKRSFLALGESVISLTFAES